MPTTTKLTTAMLRGYPDLMTVKNVQDILNIGRTKAYSLLQSGELHSIRVGTAYRVPKPYLIDYIRDKS